MKMEVNEPRVKGRAIPIGEIGASDAIEVDPGRLSDSDAFMEEKLLIMVHPDSNKESLDVITPAVNGVNMPIARGAKTEVRRKYVEALAKGRYTRYEQRVVDPSRPENIQMVEVTNILYPFTVYEDPSGDKGRSWLEGVLEQ